MAKTLDTIRGEVEDEITNVRDQMAELSAQHGRLVGLRDSLDATPLTQEVLAPADEGRIIRPKRKRSMPAKKGAAKPAAKGKPGRKKGSGNRRGEVLSVLSKSKRGLTVAQIGVKLGIKPNYLHRIVNALVAEKLVERNGKNVKVVG